MNNSFKSNLNIKTSQMQKNQKLFMFGKQKLLFESQEKSIELDQTQSSSYNC